MATVIGSSPKRLLFNDGEGVNPADWNDLQAFVHSMLGDLQILSARDNRSTAAVRPGTISTLIGDWTGTAFTGRGGAWVDYQNGTPRGYTNMAGVFAQWVGSTIDGEDPQLLACYVPADTFAEVITAPTTSARWDLIQYKLEVVDGDSETRDFEDATTRAKSTTTPNKRRKVQMTWSRKEGAEGGSIPAPDSGYVRWAAIQTTVGQSTDYDPKTQIRDFRVPMGQWIHCRALGKDVFAKSGSSWMIGGTLPWVADAGSGAEVGYWHPPACGGNANARLMAVGCAGELNSLKIETARWNPAQNPISEVFSAAIGPFQDYPTGAGETTLYDQTIGSNTTPIWGNGYYCGPSAWGSGGGGQTGSVVAMLTCQATGADKVAAVDFWFACG